MNHSEEKELSILEKIHKSKDSIKQRDLAKITGLSLGMTNTILKRLVEKGLITIKKVNNRNIVYAVSPLGIEEISAKSYNFFKRTIKNVVVYKEAIGRIIKEIKEKGYKKIFLAGKSDIDFIVEHMCSKNQMQYSSGETPNQEEQGIFIIYSESINKDSVLQRNSSGSGNKREKNNYYLKDIIV
ncbi:MAG: winged helix-turn-helix transcriptional regulator [Spirochaetaceae bacterium]|nr:winged helix-turn-helix transcriptional regulator [Spirochaetaceae bacterium]